MINENRLAEVLTKPIMKGAHPSQDGMCVMEAVAYVSGESWSDSPKCASRPLAAFLRRWNDGIQDDLVRTRIMHPLIAKLVGTAASPEIEKRRVYMIVDWALRVMTPTWLELAGLTAQATLLRELAEVTDQATAKAARSAARKTRDASGAKRVAAREALQKIVADLKAKGATAAAYAADYAADAAAYAAAADAAAYAAAAAAAAHDAAAAHAAAAYAHACAYDAAYAAAAQAAIGDFGTAKAVRTAVQKKLAPTVEQLQASALELVDRVIAMGAEQ